MKALGSLLKLLGGLFLVGTLVHLFLVGVPRLQKLEDQFAHTVGVSVLLSYFMVGLVSVAVLAIGEYVAHRYRPEERQRAAAAFPSSRIGSRVRCTTCQGELEYLGDPGSMFSPTASVVGPPSAFWAMQQWRGNVCVKCRSVYCEKCLELGGPTPCPSCGEPTYPAQRMYLEQAGRL